MKYTAEQVLAHADTLDELGMEYDPTGRDMLREYAAHLAAQSEWPSEADERVALSAAEKWARENGFVAYMVPTGYMRAALQSVRPPSGVVSNAEVAAARDAYTDALNATGGTPIKAIRAAIESYASRHAPTKD